MHFLGKFRASVVLREVFISLKTNTSLANHQTSKFRTVTTNTCKWQDENLNQVSKALLRFKYLRLIKTAAREQGPIAELNPKLAKYINEAKKCDLPSSSISSALKMVTNYRVKSGITEVFCPGGCLMVVQHETIDPCLMDHCIDKICVKYDATLVAGVGNRLKYYNQKGIIVVNNKDLEKPVEDQDYASTVGAESVNQELNLEGEEILTFYCDPSALNQVKKNIQNIGHVVEEAYVGYIPKITVNFPLKSSEKVANIIIELSELPEIDRVYENLQKLPSVN